MDATFEDAMNQMFMGRAIKGIYEASIQGRQVQGLLEKLGTMVGDIMQVEIDDWPGSNSPTTIKRKGFNDPLFDTGKMLESVKFQIHQ
ncbi:hypothetical protein D3C80_526990 [compost metagenome]